MKNSGLILFLFSSICISSCKTIDPQVHPDFSISNGQNFGFCIGPCQQSFTMNSQDLNTSFSIKSIIINENDTEVNEQKFQEYMVESEWKEILNAVDLEVFMDLDEVHGCPDCADGGSEWIEIRSPSQIHRVTFEYGKSVDKIKKMIFLLREKRTELSKKYITQE